MISWFKHKWTRFWDMDNNLHLVLYSLLMISPATGLLIASVLNERYFISFLNTGCILIWIWIGFNSALMYGDKQRRIG